MLSKARIAGHPIHPMLVALPIGMFVATVATLLAFMNSGDPFYYRAAMVANVGGVVAALVAAVPGTIDLFSLPPGSSARATGIKHASSALLAVGLFAVSAALLWRGWNGLANGEVLAAAVPLAVSLAGMLVLVIVGALGWTLVQTHHVGVRPDLVRGHATIHRPSFHH
ncbi:MAG: DUF2231 domain-containing protein [Kofleriaceae bacterium]